VTARISDRRRALTALAGAVLESEGLDAFGLGALARAAGVKTPSLYKHFDGLADLEGALISEGFTALASALEGASGIRAFAETYRAHALARPQLYRLMTSRPLDRSRLEPGAELAAMTKLLDAFGESPADHPRARTLWAWAHGLVILQIDDRFPSDADLDASWEVLIATADGWTRTH